MTSIIYGKTGLICVLSYLLFWCFERKRSSRYKIVRSVSGLLGLSLCSPIGYAATASKTTTAPSAPSGFSAVWANTGEDKVTQSELRASTSGSAVVNSAWDGSSISVFGAKNEVVGFNVILEAGNLAASGVSVQLQTLTGPEGATISSPSPNPATIFDWTSRNIELFFVRYLQIKGLSYFGYNSGSEGYDERIVPRALETPFTGTGYVNDNGAWTDRPNHDAFYPDIAIPLELNPTFTVAQGTNQSIWVDIYIPKTAAPGVYTGNLIISENAQTTWTVPVQLTVRSFSLPDVPASKTMLFFGFSDLARRLTGNFFPDSGSAAFSTTANAALIAYKIAHRHKISLLADWQDQTADQPSAAVADALTGNLFTTGQQYAGPGTGTGNNVYSVLAYGGFRSAWQAPGETDVSETDVWKHAASWESWFQANAPATDRFVYLCDECNGSNSTPTPQQVDLWATWFKVAPGIGSLKTFATTGFDTGATVETDVDYIADTAIGNGPPNNTALWTGYVNAIHARGSEAMMYNPARPIAGSFTIEDDGVALRELPWAAYKKGLDRFFYWNSNYYWNFQSAGQVETNVFENAATFGSNQVVSDPSRGEWSVGHTNGEGVLFYPGTDVVYPQDSYGVNGVFASLRLKHWRRGVQDIDYVTLASAIDPVTTQEIVAAMVPKAFWDFTDLGGYVSEDISYSINPDDWEAARSQLAQIIEKQSALSALISPSGGNLGSQALGNSSASNIFTMVNTGSSTIQIAGIGTTGVNAGDFTVTSNNCGNSLAVGATCLISITFAPQAKGSRTGSLTVTDNTPTSPHLIALIGAGVGIPLGSVAPNFLTFTNQPIGATSAGQTVTLSNPGTQGLSIASISLGGTNSGDFAITSNTCLSVLAVGASCLVTVNFSPLAPGVRAASLTFTDTAGNSPQLVNLIGTVSSPATSGSAVATFKGSDATTLGDWTGIYGADGQVIANDLNNVPSYAQVSIAGAHSYTWTSLSNDPRALQVSSGASAHIASTYYSNGFSIDLNLTDNNAHNVSLYLCDIDYGARVEMIAIVDAASQTVLSTQTVAAFSTGVYETWSIKGHVQIQVIYDSGSDAIVNGIFFDPPPGVNISSAPFPSKLQFVPVTPCRAVDTRWAVGTFGGPELNPGAARDFPIPASACGIPSTAMAYSVNVTVVPDGPLGSLTMGPSGVTQPLVSTLNSDSRIKANGTIVTAGANGGIAVDVSDATHVILDINGYFVAGDSAALAFYPLAPCRVADTRTSNGDLGAPSLSAGISRTFPIIQATSCNIPPTARAFSLNFTAVPRGTLGYLSTWPAGQSRPLVSTLNAPTAAVTANAAIVPAGIGGAVNVYASDASDLVIDINGYFAPPATGGLSLYQVAPCRALDTRAGSGFFSGTLVADLAITSCHPPESAQAFVLNMTVLPQGSLQYATLWPTGQTQPAVSTLNAQDGAVTSNMAIVPVWSSSVSVFVTDKTQLILDISGYFAP
jgi:Domain of unknown function (DUF4091)/Family of unknown function (DUF6067)